MTSEQNISCYLIGVESLLAECGQVLQDAGADIRGVVSDAPLITQWAERQGIATIAPGDAEVTLAAQVGERPVDYLLAIGQYEPLSEALLKLPGKGTVNFHDGPLPAYEGLNVPAWAILRREERHGVTWHDVDAGGATARILETRSFDLADDETTLTLNTKCFEAAIESFRALAPGLMAGELSGEPVAEGGRQFGAGERPERACTLDWRKPAEELERLVRALDHGPYANPMGVAKLIDGDTRLLVTAARVHDGDGSGAPGTVLSVSDEGLVIATADGALRITELSCPAGIPVELPALGDKHGILEGKQLELLDDALAERLTSLGPVLAGAEDFWTARLSGLDPYQLPYAAGEGSGHVTVPLTLPEAFAGRYADPATRAAACIVYLARLSGREHFDLGFSGPRLARESVGLERWIGTRVPLRVALDGVEDFAAAAETLKQTQAELDEHVGWLRDLVVRQPQLKARAELHQNAPSSVCVAVRERAADFTPDDNEQLAIVVADDACCLVVSEQLPERVRESIAGQLTTLLQGLGDAPETPLSKLPLLDDAERDKLLVEWNKTPADYDRDACVHQLFERQAERTPDAVALVYEGQELSYGELNQRANKLAHHLRGMGVGPDSMVGLHVERSLDLMVGALGIQKAGGGYIPLDPDYPSERIAFMIEDSGVKVLLTHEHLRNAVPTGGAAVVCLDSDWGAIDAHPDGNVDSGVGVAHIAYVIYTSGSTGKPKGVMVEHRNVVNFFAGMDGVISHEPPGVWLAVTSLSFDISVLELFWTLGHGFKIVLHRDRTGQQQAPAPTSNRPMDFGFFLWGSEDSVSKNKYRLMLEAAKFGDKNGFSSVSTPERHFHAFGGPYPNPSVTGAAIAAATSNIQIRAGSCVAPLHHPARIAEEWAVVDNISNGRVGLSFASGWQPDDFLLRPENHKQAKQAMLDTLDTVRKLWRGETVPFPGALGEDVDVVTQPRPVQAELPFWVTTAGNPETYRQAGELGANILTHLLGQSLPEVGDKIRIYREARKAAGHDPDAGVVTLMLHTFVGEDVDAVRELVRDPMKNYLRSAVGLIKNFAWSFTAFQRPAGAEKPEDVDLQSLSDEEMDAILNAAFERYFETSGLFGTPDSCMQMVEDAKAHGVDEIACLIDYGVSTDEVLDALPHLNEVRRRANPPGASKSAPATEAPAAPEGDFSIPALIRQHGVTHFQCTPSMARMLALDPDAREALAPVQHMMVGGEAFPLELGRDLTGLLSGKITNMYGPTETTIWSSTHTLEPNPSTIPIGRPIANTQLYVLDARLQPLPLGVPGELFIGGDGVVRGYHDRPELTAERFVRDPFAGGEARIYRTGDLARWREDGRLEYLGRTDFQVKLRGHRIELGEIEARLSEHGAVTDCVVMAREDTPGDQRLVAYVVAGAPAASEAQLKDHLRERVPDYMVPSHVVELDKLPLTPNGKVDRKALPAPRELQQQRAAAAHAEPEGELQGVIAGAWKATLGLDAISANDNFFDIGGHSLLVVQLHRKLAGLLDKPLSLTDLYRFPTIASLAGHLSSDSGAADAKRSNERASRRREALQRRRRRVKRS